MLNKFLFITLIAFIAPTINVFAGNTPEEDLFDAISRKDIKKFEKVIKKKDLNINAFNSQGYNFLHTLFSNPTTPFLSDNETKMLKELIAKGCDVNALERTSYQTSVLEGAVRSQDVNAVKLVLEAGANPKQGYPLHMACFKRSLSCAKLLVEKGVDVNKAQNGETPLIPLLTYADPYNMTNSILELLHKNGADIFVRTYKGESLLDLANKNKNWKAAAYLKERGVIAYIKPPQPTKPDYGDKKVRMTMSRKYSREKWTPDGTIVNIILLDVTPDKLNFYDEDGDLVSILEVLKSSYTTYNGVDAVEYITKNNDGVKTYVYLLEIPDMYTYSNGIKTYIDGYNRVIIKDYDGTIQFDAEF